MSTLCYSSQETKHLLHRLLILTIFPQSGMLKLTFVHFQGRHNSYITITSLILPSSTENKNNKSTNTKRFLGEYQKMKVKVLHQL